ncbi:MAG: hypothetical protein ACFFER_06060 [Candidatus Thorarchaeota archaeon]
MKPEPAMWLIFWALSALLISLSLVVLSGLIIKSKSLKEASPSSPYVGVIGITIGLVGLFIALDFGLIGVFFIGIDWVPIVKAFTALPGLLIGVLFHDFNDRRT